MRNVVLALAIAGSVTSIASARPLYVKDLNLNGDNGAFAYVDQQIADDFMLAADASVSQATWYGNFISSGDPFNTGAQFTFAVRFYNDTGSGPALTAFSEQLVVATLSDTGLSQENDAIYHFAANLNPVGLSGGVKYYLNIEEIDSTTPKPSFRWNNGANDIDDNVMYFTQGASGWNQSGEPRTGCAFTLDVPAPSAALVGLAGVVAVGRRRR
ncbi:MAG: hypothetical protein AMXMBFR58_13030 [Phycisphaerae bacterium]